jgi:hypothetical protein
MIQTIPKLLPKGVSAEEMEANVKSTQNSMTAIVIIQVIMSVFLKGIIDDLWGIFLILQVLAYLSIYDISKDIPTSAIMYVESIRDVVTFKVLKPDPILNMIKPGLTIDVLMGAAKGTNTNLP